MSNFDPKELGEELPPLAVKAPAEDSNNQMVVEAEQERPTSIDPDKLALFRRNSLTLGKQTIITPRQDLPGQGEDEEMKQQQDDQQDRMITEDSQRPDFGQNLQDLVTESQNLAGVIGGQKIAMTDEDGAQQESDSEDDLMHAFR